MRLPRQNATLEIESVADGQGASFSAVLQLCDCRRLRRLGPDDTNDDATAQEMRGFQFEHLPTASSDSGATTFRFCLAMEVDLNTWFMGLRREMTRAGWIHSVQAAPAKAISDQLTTGVAQAPILDEDLQFVLWNTEGAKSLSEGIPPSPSVGDVACKELVCTVYIPVPNNIGSHGRDKIIPFTPETISLAADQPLMQVVDTIASEKIRPHMAPDVFSRFAAFLYTDIGEQPLRLSDTKSLCEIPAVMAQFEQGLQPRLSIADLGMQTHKYSLMTMLINPAASSAEIGRLPELQAYKTVVAAIKQMVDEDVASAASMRTRLQQSVLLASNSPHRLGPLSSATVSKINLSSSRHSTNEEGDDPVIFSGWMVREGCWLALFSSL